MDVWRQVGSYGSKAWWAAAAALTVVVLTSAQGGPVTEGSLLRGVVGTIAAVLLTAVTTASVHEDHRRRALSRHLSIRADIAAAGGLGKRLMV
ncbi:MAG: hypothetical protein ACRD0N_01245 [Acidimicrobiales bacterium]